MKFAKVRDVKSPIRGTDKSAGIDFFIPNDYPGSIFLARGQAVSIPSGIHAKIPEGFALVAMNKSGVATQKYLQVGACVVDEDYQGEIHIHVTNVGNDLQELNPGDKLVQFLLIPVIYPSPEEVKDLESLYSGEVTQRGEGGFGSTNKTYKKGEIVEFRPVYARNVSKFEVLEDFEGSFQDNMKNLKEITIFSGIKEGEYLKGAFIKFRQAMNENSSVFEVIENFSGNPAENMDKLKLRKL